MTRPTLTATISPPTVDQPAIDRLDLGRAEVVRRLVPTAVTLVIGLPLMAGPAVACVLLSPGPAWALLAATTPVLLTALFLFAFTKRSDHR